MPLWIISLLGFAGALVAATIGAVTALITIRRTSQNTQFTVRAQVKTTYRTKWLDSFRSLSAELLFLGQQVHSPLPGADGPTLEERRRLREVTSNLVVLLGRETDNVGVPLTRFRLAERVRAYALAPSALAEEELEDLMQEVFVERWSQIKRETGEIDEGRLVVVPSRLQSTSGVKVLPQGGNTQLPDRPK